MHRYERPGMHAMLQIPIMSADCSLSCYIICVYFHLEYKYMTELKMCRNMVQLIPIRKMCIEKEDKALTD